MEIEKDKYFVLELSGRRARVASMNVYEVFQSGIDTGEFIDSYCHCLNVTKEEARVLMKLMGLEDVSNLWSTVHLDT